MIMKLLAFRTLALKVYQKTRFIINPIVKFLLSMWVFGWINGEIGYDPRFTSKTIVMLLSVICAVTPGGVMVFFAMVLTLVHVFHASILLAGLLFLMFVVLYGLLMRFSPEHALAAVAVPVLTKYNLHYCVPMVLGCTANPISALPCACGVIIYHMMTIVKTYSGRQVDLKNLDQVLELFMDVINAFLANKHMMIAVIVFALVITAIFVVRKGSFDFAFIISIGAGIVVNILGFLVLDLHFNVAVNAGKLILFTLVAGAVALVLEFFKRVLDYTAIERVQFEDDDYYYYVKAVPKVNVGVARHSIKRMSDYSDDTETDPEFDEEEETREFEAEAEDVKEYKPKRKSPFAFNRSDYIKDQPKEAGPVQEDSEIRYEEFDDSDFSEDAPDFDKDLLRYDKDEDMASYGMTNIGPSKDSDSAPGEDEEFETWMTLDDDDK